MYIIHANMMIGIKAVSEHYMICVHTAFVVAADDRVSVACLVLALA